MTENATEQKLCIVGGATDSPCTNAAITETDFGSPVCETHAAIIDLGAVADDYTLVRELLDEAIEKAKDVHARPAAVMLLERTRVEARREYRRISQEMAALEPERGF